MLISNSLECLFFQVWTDFFGRYLPWIPTEALQDRVKSAGSGRAGLTALMFPMAPVIAVKCQYHKAGTKRAKCESFQILTLNRQTRSQSARGAGQSGHLLFCSLCDPPAFSLLQAVPWTLTYSQTLIKELQNNLISVRNAGKGLHGSYKSQPN